MPQPLPLADLQLADASAEGTLLYNDGTMMRILNFTQEARVDALPPGARTDRTGAVTSGLVVETAHDPIALFTTGPCHAGEHPPRCSTGPMPVRASPAAMGSAGSTWTCPPGIGETVAWNDE